MFAILESSPIIVTLHAFISIVFGKCLVSRLGLIGSTIQHSVMSGVGVAAIDPSSVFCFSPLSEVESW